MDLATVVEYIQALLVLVVFFAIITGGFRVWAKRSANP
jgi:hypothetical protein